ncbi:MAG: ABA4-like family protein [Candidatus Promineifilaceae bacterium]
MDFDTIFSLSNAVVMPFWLLMIALPHWRWTKRIISSPWIVAPVALIYAVLVIPQAGGLLGSLANPTLEGISSVIGTPGGATIGWAHFLAFDLFVGRWVYLDSRARGISAWLTGPALFFVLMLGPMGFLAYLVVRVFSAEKLPSN